MRHKIELPDKAIYLECNAATPIIAKRMFDTDYMEFFSNIDSANLGNQTDKLMQFVYVMAAQALVQDKCKGMSEQLTALSKLTENDYIEWLSGIDFNDMVEKVIPEALNFWTTSNKTNSKPKNAGGQQ